MGVGIDEARNHQLSIEIDERGRRAGELADGVRLSDGDELAAPDGDRAGNGLRGIERRDLAVEINDVRCGSSIICM